MKIEFENEDEFHRFISAMAEKEDCCPDNFGMEKIDTESCFSCSTTCEDCWEKALQKAMEASE